MKKISIVLAIIIIILISGKKEEIIIPESAVRFRVISSSNKINDINEKNYISNHLTKYITNLTSNSTSSDETLDILNTNYDNIIQYLNEINPNLSYNLSIGRNYFPSKKYKGINYKAGYYNSIVLTLGNGVGVNWWCVIYPPLCLIDENKSNYEYTTIVSELLEKYE